MKVTGCYGVVCAILIGTAIPRIAWAQEVEPACTVGINNFIIYRITQMENAAFSATAKTSYEQRLPDGNYVRGYVRTHGARDAAGRTMIEVAQSCRKGKNGVLQPDLHVKVLDPVKKTRFTGRAGQVRTKKPTCSTHRRCSRKLIPQENSPFRIKPLSSSHRKANTKQKILAAAPLPD